jgi:hypothetical protein
MKKVMILTGAFILAGDVVSGQVGVNTTAPKSTMDVSVKRNTAGTITDNSQVFGLQAPRVTLAELTANTAIYNTDQQGALIYITDVSGGTAIGQRVHIDAVGYYSFDGSLWQKLNSTEPWYDTATNTSATANTQDIYQMGKVGVMIKNPMGLLHTYNNSSSANPFTVESDNAGNGLGNDSYLYGYGSSMSPGLFFLSARGSKISPVSLQNGDLMGEFNYGGYLSTGWNYSLTSVRSVYNGDGTSPDSSLAFLTSNAVRVTMTSNGNVGVGTETPTEKLDNSGITRLRALPLNGATNAINTTSGGNASSTQNQTFTATKTVVADNNGVLGYVTGLPNNIYNANGLLTSERTLTNNGFALYFQGSTNYIDFDSTGAILQTAFGGIKRASIVLNSNDNDSNGVTSRLQMFQDPEHSSQIKATDDSRALSIGTTSTTLSAPISFTTSAGSGAVGKQRMIITGEGNVGIGTNSYPAARFHVIKAASDLTPAILEGCNTYTDNAAATAAGLPVGALYRKADGTLMVTY